MLAGLHIWTELSVLSLFILLILSIDKVLGFRQHAKHWTYNDAWIIEFSMMLKIFGGELKKSHDGTV